MNPRIFVVYARGSPKIWLPIRLIFHVFFLNILGITKKLDDLGFPMSFFCVYEVNIKNLHDLLVGGLEHFLFSHILGTIIPID